MWIIIIDIGLKSDNTIINSTDTNDDVTMSEKCMLKTEFLLKYVLKRIQDEKLVFAERTVIKVSKMSIESSWRLLMLQIKVTNEENDASDASNSVVHVKLLTMSLSHSSRSQVSDRTKLSKKVRKALINFFEISARRFDVILSSDKNSFSAFEF